MIEVKAGLNEKSVGLTRKEALPVKASVYGVVTDINTGETLGGIKVVLGGAERITDGNGHYEFADIDPGNYTLSFMDPQGVYESLVV